MSKTKGSALWVGAHNASTDFWSNTNRTDTRRGDWRSA